MITARATFASSLALLLLAAGCSGQTGQTGKVTVLMKDAPADVTAAVVTISEIDLVGSGGVTVLSTTKTTTDLLSLANDTATLVKDFEVPVGSYSQLRFVITGGYVEAGGVIYASSPTYEGLPPETTAGGTLRMPSYAQSGLKVDLPATTVEAGGSTILLVDFDVSQSFGHEAGNSGAWVMHPVVKATDFVLAGRVDVTLKLDTGVTLPAPATLADFKAVLTPAPPASGGNTILALTSTDATTYGASFKYLFPGDYALTFNKPSSVNAFATAPTVPAIVTVASGQATAAAFVMTAAH